MASLCLARKLFGQTARPCRNKPAKNRGGDTLRIAGSWATSTGRYIVVKLSLY